MALEEHYKLNSWAKIFFTDDIHIVGLGLTQSEIDIWWLITYRAFLYYSNRFGAKRLISNTIIYHDVSTELDTNMKYALNNCHIQYQFHKIAKKIQIIMLYTSRSQRNYAKTVLRTNNTYEENKRLE